MISLDGCNRIFIPSKTEDINLNGYESKTLTKHISCDCKCKFNGKKCNSNQN